MSDKAINDGGSAFPVPSAVFDHGTKGELVGMTLRDWFAGVALGNAYVVSNMAGEKNDAIAGSVYAMADAMIAERNSE